MICPSCCNGDHTKCVAPATCPCHHKRGKLTEDGKVAPLKEEDDDV